MAFTDEATFHARAGRGGDGVVRWRREKFKPKGGPSGGDGGDGGDFILEGTRDITALQKVIQKNFYEAEDGEDGSKNSMHGANGKDYILHLPVGSLVRNRVTNESVELLKEGERVRLLRGGVGGFGNEHFKSSVNRTPMQATKGKEGEEGDFHVELKLIADIGLVGLPNAGKTSLLNALTNAGAKVGDYPFTTLDPNLGMYFKYVVADIPGLIEGASEGKGLGHKFLRHISRTNVILHCISLERDTILADYHSIKLELESYPGLNDIPEYIVLTKSDTKEPGEIRAIKNELETAIEKTVFCTVSILDDRSIKELGDAITALMK